MGEEAAVDRNIAEGPGPRPQLLDPWSEKILNMFACVFCCPCLGYWLVRNRAEEYARDHADPEAAPADHGAYQPPVMGH